MAMQNVRVTRQSDRGSWSAVDGPVKSLLIEVGDVAYELTPFEDQPGFELRVAGTSIGNVELQAVATSPVMFDIFAIPVRD